MCSIDCHWIFGYFISDNPACAHDASKGDGYPAHQDGRCGGCGCSSGPQRTGFMNHRRIMEKTIWLVVEPYPSEKWWSSSVGMMKISQLNGKIWKVIEFHGSSHQLWFYPPWVETKNPGLGASASIVGGGFIGGGTWQSREGDLGGPGHQLASGHMSGICSGIYSGILSGISSDILSGKSSGILSGKHSGTLSGIPSGILSGITSRILSGISSGILSDMLSGVLSGNLLAFYLAVEVQRCTLSWEGPRLRSSGAHWALKVPGWGPAVAHWAGKVPGWGPAVHTELGRSQVEVQQCALSWESPRLRSCGAHWAGKLAKSLAKRVGKELGEELARRKWRWKLMQTWSRRN